jgi:hypothetical protein
LLLVCRRPPSAVDVELDPIALAPGIRCRLAERGEESWVKVGHSRIFVVEDRHAIRHLAISDTQVIVMLARRLAGRVAENVATQVPLSGVHGRLRGVGRCSRRRARQRTANDDTHERCDDDQDSGKGRSSTARSSPCWLAV